MKNWNSISMAAQITPPHHPNEDLLPGWTTVADQEGNHYYWNKETDEVKVFVIFLLLFFFQHN